jgi:DNA-binding transcriptional LysR family regulator
MNDRAERRLKLETLRVLMTVVQAGSMGKAAERLHTSQPNISRSIAELEHALGVRLLDRQRQGVEPTPYGRALLDCGVTVFDDLRQGLKNIEFLADPTKGELRIGIVPFAMSFVSDIIDRLSQRYSRIVFHIATAEVETLHEQLIGRKLDVLIAKIIGPFVGERFSVQPLFDDPYVIVAGTQHPLARRRKIKPAELAMQAWTLPPPESVYGADLAQVFQAIGIDYPRATVYSIPSSLRARLARTGRFLTIFHASVLRAYAEGAALNVLPVELEAASGPVGAIILRNRTLSPVAQLFIEHARDVAKSHAKPT